MSEEHTVTLDAHHSFAIQANSRVWELLGAAARTPDEDDDLLYAAFASCYHWRRAGTRVQQQRGEYLIAKAYIALGQPGEALRHAQYCLSLSQQYASEMQDFDWAFAHELLARVLAMNGDYAAAQRHYQQARQAGTAIKDPEDRSIFLHDFEHGNWFGLDLRVSP